MPVAPLRTPIPCRSAHGEAQTITSGRTHRYMIQARTHRVTLCTLLFVYECHNTILDAYKRAAWPGAFCLKIRKCTSSSHKWSHAPIYDPSESISGDSAPPRMFVRTSNNPCRSRSVAGTRRRKVALRTSNKWRHIKGYTGRYRTYGVVLCSLV